MAMYIKLEIGGELIEVFGVQRLHDLEDGKDKYRYTASRYVIKPNGDAEKGKEMKILTHQYSEGAAVLAQKVLTLFATPAANRRSNK